jgi:diguanylate cyclase (GGDEF)-like protein
MSQQNPIKLPTILIPIILFVIFDTVALGINFWISNKLEQSAVAINLSGRQRMLSQRMTKSLLMLHVAEHDTDKQSAFDEFSSTVKLFDKTLLGFREGGMTEGGDGKPLYLPAVSEQNAALITASASQLWAIVNSHLLPVITADMSIEHTILHPALQTLLEYNQPLLKQMNELTTALEQNATREVAYLRVFQASLLILALINFALVCKRLLRQIHQSDNNFQSLRTIIDSIETGILLYDSAELIRSSNKAADRLFGYDEEKVTGKHLHQLVLSDDHKTFGIKSDSSTFVAKISTQTLFEFNDQISVCTITDVSEQTRKEQELTHLAFHDALTGLPNRILLVERLQQDVLRAKRDSAILAVMFVDLDGFKAVNDELGHDVGDALLKSVTKRFKQCCREVDTVARLGGDEFVFIISSFQSVSTAKMVAQSIIKAVNQAFLIQQHSIKISASIGIALYPKDHEEAELLIKHADDAMYLAKQQGKNRFAFASDLRSD